MWSNVLRLWVFVVVYFLSYCLRTYLFIYKRFIFGLFYKRVVLHLFADNVVCHLIRCLFVRYWLILVIVYTYRCCTASAVHCVTCTIVWCAAMAVGTSVCMYIVQWFWQRTSVIFKQFSMSGPFQWNYSPFVYIELNWKPVDGSRNIKRRPRKGRQSWEFHHVTDILFYFRKL